MRAKEFKSLMEFSASNSPDMEILAKHTDEIYFLQSAWKKYFSEVDYLKIYPNLKFDNSKIKPIAERIDHFLDEHRDFFRSEKTNLVFHGHIVENYRFFYETIEAHKFPGSTVKTSIDITDLIVFDKI